MEELIPILSERRTRSPQVRQAKNLTLPEESKGAHNVDGIVGQSDVLKFVLFRAKQVASTDTTVLLLGETGVGKELFARAIHQWSPRHARPLIKVDCTALPASLIESELFGHEKGAFTQRSSVIMGANDYYKKVTDKNVAQILLEYLKLEKVDQIFGIPGAAIMQLLVELDDQKIISSVT